MIVVNGTVETDVEAIEELKSVLATMEAASRAEEGCDDYTFSVEVNDPSKVRITERWHDEEALRAHFASEHMAAFQAAMGKRPPRNMSITFYRAEPFDFTP